MGSGARAEGVSEGIRLAPDPSGERVRAMVGRCVGYFSGTASDRRLLVYTGQWIINHIASF